MKNHGRFNANHALLIEEAAELASGDARLAHTYMKEMLHHDMLAALVNDGWANKLIFKGGTCLRLAYGGSRLSEDLDFNHQLQFDSTMVNELAKSIERHVATVYDLPTLVKLPKQASSEELGSVLTWQLQVQVAPGRRDVPSQKIKIDLSSTPSYTREFTPIASMYKRRINTQSNDMLPIYSESREEIASDKVIAFANRPGERIKARDIWDLIWLEQQGVKPDYVMVEKKAQDYKIEPEQFIAKMEMRIEQLNTDVSKRQFIDEMSRFLTAKQRKELINNPDFIEYAFTLSESILREQLEIFQANHNGNAHEDEATHWNRFKI